MKSCFAFALILGAGTAVSACQSAGTTPAPAAPPGQPPYAQPPYAQPGQPPYGQPPYAQPPYAQPQTPQYPAPQPTPPYAQPAPAPPPIAARPLLAPLAGAAAWQQEARNVFAELINALSPANQQKVRGIPLVFDPSSTDVNAFAGCDDQGAPFVTGTEGLLEAVDAMSQTRATDEQFGTQTYEAYLAWVAPRLVSQAGTTAALPGGIIPAQYWGDARRWSRAHEIFDETVAFTFGHELGHHYLGHTGCANGQAASNGPSPARIGQLLIQILPGLNQPNEVAADTVGTINTLDAGLARRATGYQWSERGALMLLDFFARLDRASGVTPLNPIGFLRTHPNSAIRIPIVQATAQTWHFQHPG